MAISIGENLAFHVNHSPDNECGIFLNSNSLKKLLIPTLGGVFDIICYYVGESSVLDLMLPGISLLILEVFKALMVYIFLSVQMPALPSVLGFLLSLMPTLFSQKT